VGEGEGVSWHVSSLPCMQIITIAWAAALIFPTFTMATPDLIVPLVPNRLSPKVPIIASE
jgi:hypothetical protein